MYFQVRYIHLLMENVHILYLLCIYRLIITIFLLKKTKESIGFIFFERAPNLKAKENCKEAILQSSKTVHIFSLF